MSDDLSQRVYPEDEHLRQLQKDPDRRMTRAEWEREESQARQAAHKKHEKVQHDRDVQQEYDRKHRSKHRNWKKIFLWIGAGVLALLLIFLLGYLPRHEREKKAAAAAKQREQEQPQVEVMQVKRSHAPGELTVPGTTAPLTEAFIYARANGYLRQRFVDIGDHVKKGQLMALIDAPDLDQQVDQAREQLRQAEAQEAQQQAQLALNKVTWERWRVLVAKGVFSRQDGDQREADYNTQVAVVASAHRNVESFRANLGRVIALQSYERVTAPFDGVVTQRNTDIGALVGTSGAGGTPLMPSSQNPSAGTASAGSTNTSGSSGSSNQAASPSTGQAQGGPLFAVAQFDKLRILVSVPEGYASDIKTGMPAQVFVQERSGKPIEGTVTRAALSLDQNTRTMLTEVDVDNRDGGLYPGMYAVVSFVEVRGVGPITVPGDAVVVRDDRTSVAIVNDNKIKIVPVEIGRDYGPSVEILSGLQEGELVITTVTDTTQPGMKVRPQQKQEAGENNGQGGAQTNKVPNSGPQQYGDQSIVNSQGESTNQKGKPGQGGQQQNNQQKQSKDQVKAQKKQQSKESSQ
ncbi:multidrug efflux pump subunit AcrA (membrane-fusion protein) [Silvibacterium bohemicum]|uniref:Multidrug efflux pump subunit AcrA (Membrane-fusion protein) n=1 Tax=Silvibacterium bohemicum TaxID=1577686 RepID=A0A841JVS7_9BACT|nr:efflux RND transporter periplasmic adaptor subunit [Silvibacterium bohemicum]MBB6143091.1 multidrug efflux pump subunit AcrA (membrane-fusion protein) [Silvibacterium bohemicum]